MFKSDDPNETFEDVTVNEPKDVSKGKHDTLVVEEKPSEAYTFKSEDPRFLDFTTKLEDWSEEHKKDAYANNFKLYLTASFGFS